MCLPDLPNGNIVIMENLHTLKGVSNFKCDGTMARRIPNIKKLGLIYYGKAMVESCDDDDEDSESFDDKYFLHNMECLQLESLSCENRGTSDLFRKLTLPHSLRSLNLDSGVNGTESILEKVSILPVLEKLQLVFGRFTRGKWETVEGQFLSLKYLSLGWCLGLEWWVMENSHFPCLENLLLDEIPLKEIPAELGDIPTLKSVHLYYCCESAVESAKRMVEEQEESEGELSYTVQVSLRHEDAELQSLENPYFKVVVPR